MTLEQLKQEIEKEAISYDKFCVTESSKQQFIRVAYRIATLTAEAMVGEFENRRTAIEGVMYEDTPISLGYNLRVSEEHQLAREIKKLSE